MTDTAAGNHPPHPSTILVVHPKERRSKCSLEPLRNRPGFVFWTFPGQDDQPLDQYVRLGMGGPLIGPDDAHQGLLILDGTWDATGVLLEAGDAIESTAAGLPYIEGF